MTVPAPAAGTPSGTSIDEYSQLLSRAFAEIADRFAAVASPTMSKQETVTFLYQEVLACVEGHGRRSSFVRALSLRAEFIVRLVVKFAAVIVASRRFRLRALPRGAIYIRTWLVPRSFRATGVVDDYFRRLIDDLRRAGRPFVVGCQPMALREYFRGFRGLPAPPEFVVPVGLLSLSDVCSLFVEYVRSGRARVSRRYEFAGVDITGALNRSLADDYFKLRSFQAYLDRYVAERVAPFEPRACLYIFENQGWEKAMLLAFRGTATQFIGYQSSGFSDRFLNFFPNAADRDQQPFPSAILTVGDLFRDVMRTKGCYAMPIVTFGALRFEYPVSGDRYVVQPPNTARLGRILYAFAVHEYQYPGIIRDLVDAFGGRKVEVVLKFHPLCGDKYAGLSLPPNFHVWAPDPAPLRERYDAVLFNDNSFGFESLLQGVKAFEYTCERVYAERRMYNFDLYDFVLDRASLPAFRDSLESGSFDKSFSVERASAYLNGAFRPHTEAAATQLLQRIDGTPS